MNEKTAGSLTLDGSLIATRLNIGPVVIHRDGRVERTASFITEEEAAKSFWKTVERLMPLQRGAL